MYVCTIFERYPFRIPSIDKWYPFNMLSLELFISFSYCKCTFFKNECVPKPLRSERFQDSYKYIKLTDYSTLSYTSTSEIPTHSYTWSQDPKMRASPYRSLWGVPPRDSYKPLLTNRFKLSTTSRLGQAWSDFLREVAAIKTKERNGLKRLPWQRGMEKQSIEACRKNQILNYHFIPTWPSHSSPSPLTQFIYKARLPSMRYNFYGNGNEEVFFFALTFWFYYVILFSSGTISLKLLHRSFYNPITDFN